MEENDFNRFDYGESSDVNEKNFNTFEESDNQSENKPFQKKRFEKKGVSKPGYKPYQGQSHYDQGQQRYNSGQNHYGSENQHFNNDGQERHNEGQPRYGGGGQRFGANKPHKSGAPQQHGFKKSSHAPGESHQFGQKNFGKGNFHKFNKKKSPFDLLKSNKLPNVSVRLNKLIAEAGICSRREADKFIKAGIVTVNGNVISELGTKVSYRDEIRYNGVKLIPEKKIYIILNKPKGFITTVNDPNAKRSVMDLVRNAGNRRLFPVGRLDRQTTGVLVFTNDGELTRRLTLPKSNVKKVYFVLLDKALADEHLQEISEGVTLDDGYFQPDLISYVKDEDKRQVGIEIHSGKNRIVRRIFEHFGYKIRKLDRVFFGGVTKKKLGIGRWRFLSKEEVTMLHQGGHAKVTLHQ